MNEEVQPVTVKCTHGFSSTLPKENTRDGIVRSVDILLSNEGNYYITIATHWPKNAEPLKTKLSLTADGLELLVNALVEASHHMNQHPLLEG